MIVAINAFGSSSPEQVSLPIWHAKPTLFFLQSNPCGEKAKSFVNITVTQKCKLDQKCKLASGPPSSIKAWLPKRNESKESTDDQLDTKLWFYP